MTMILAACSCVASPIDPPDFSVRRVSESESRCPLALRSHCLWHVSGPVSGVRAKRAIRVPSNVTGRTRASRGVHVLLQTPLLACSSRAVMSSR